MLVCITKAHLPTFFTIKYVKKKLLINTKYLVFINIYLYIK